MKTLLFRINLVCVFITMCIKNIIIKKVFHCVSSFYHNLHLEAKMLTECTVEYVCPLTAVSSLGDAP